MPTWITQHLRLKPNHHNRALFMPSATKDCGAQLMFPEVNHVLGNLTNYTVIMGKNIHQNSNSQALTRAGAEQNEQNA